MVQSRIKMLEKLWVKFLNNKNNINKKYFFRPVLLPVELESQINFRFPECEVLGNPVLMLDDVSFKWVFGNFLRFLAA